MTSVYNVSDINLYIKQLINCDANLTNICITGEISNYTVKNGIAYFKLKDRSSAISCIMFRDRLASLTFVPQDGTKVLAVGTVDVYVPYGTYSFRIQRMEADGTGKLYEEFEKLKKELSDRGWFDPARKKPLPVMPAKIGVVTSESGAVIRDILNIAYRRFPKVKITVFPVSVQGVTASAEIAAQLARISRLKCCDVVIVARGGGSIEDLWAFNELKTAKAIYECEVPVISAVGHETDFTIADFVADKRAATPSEAAEIAVPVYTEVIAKLEDYKRRLVKGPVENINLKKAELQRLAQSPCFSKQDEKIKNMRFYLDTKEEKIKTAIGNLSQLKGQQLSSLKSRLLSLNPLAVLERGYCVVKKEDGKVADSVSTLKEEDKVEIIFSDGDANAEILSVERKEREDQ
ncbi:MAG: exodeoxyribonuclease VII large subunit [Clostridia bacterium]|nr:exodeoxyribonuclease VII large subunit [Clostridia bacterium]